MPYDELTVVISEGFTMKFSTAKIFGDLLNVGVAGLVCIIFTRSFGSIGVDTVIAAYLIGKIVGWLMQHYQKYLVQWINKNEGELHKEFKENMTFRKGNTNLSSYLEDSYRSVEIYCYV